MPLFFSPESFLLSLLSQDVNFQIYRNATSTVLCGCEPWFFTSRENHRPRVFDTGVLRKVSGPKRRAVAGGKVVHVRSMNVYKGNRGINKVVARCNVSESSSRSGRFTSRKTVLLAIE